MESLSFEELIPAPLHEVWKAWTIEDGLTSFFASACKVEIKPGGPYELYFNLEAPEGSRGGEGCVILAVEPETMLSFTWNAPPEHPEIRQQKTHVVVHLEGIDQTHTKVTLTHDGWGDGAEWQQVRNYFIRAWGEIVLPRLKQRFLTGPLDWE